MRSLISKLAEILFYRYVDHFIIPIFVLKRAIGCSNWDRRLKIAKIINAIKTAKKGFIEVTKVCQVSIGFIK